MLIVGGGDGRGVVSGGASGISKKIENRIKKPIMLYTNLYTHILNLNVSNLNICSKYLLNLFNPILDFSFRFLLFSTTQHHT